MDRFIALSHIKLNQSLIKFKIQYGQIYRPIDGIAIVFFVNLKSNMDRFIEISEKVKS